MSNFRDSVVDETNLIDIECIYELSVCLSAQTYHGYAVLDYQKVLLEITSLYNWILRSLDMIILHVMV